VEDDVGGGPCAFLANTGGILGSGIQQLVQDIVNHGCGVCGSVPVFFNSGDNDEGDHGSLVIDFVSDTSGCNGLCTEGTFKV